MVCQQQTYLLANIVISTTDACCASSYDNFYQSVACNFCFPASKSIFTDGKIELTFSIVEDCEIFIGNKIFSIENFVFFSTQDGYFQLAFQNKNRDTLLWFLRINRNFSRFNYQLTSYAIEKSDFYQLTFSRFLLQHTFINHHGLIIHAAGGSINGKGMVFPAVSGTGKSTLSHLLLPHPENQLFSEERIIMRRLDGGIWHLWGTPWKGSGVIACNESAPLSALVFLSQAPETKISKLPPAAALRRLLETVSIPWYSQEWTDKGLAVCESLLRAIPAYELAFRPDQTAVQAVAELAASLD